MSSLESAIRALPMDEPPADLTLAAAAALAARTAGLIDSHGGEARELIATMAACLKAMSARQLMFVQGVPHLTAAAYLIERGDQIDLALRGARYELATLLPRPDVSIEALKPRS